MKRMISKLSTATAALLLAVGVASAQTAPQAPPAATAKETQAQPKPDGAKAAAAPKVKRPTTPEGIECSAQADAKNLHGKERKAFRAKCIRALKKANAAKSAPEPAKGAPATKSN